MSVSSSNNTTTRSLNISTEQSTRSIKSLREEIKQLRDELLNLDQGTDEYITTMVELGNKQHEIREVMTEVNNTNTDLGDNLNNMTTVIKGGVAAMQGMNSALGLMGVNLGENSELTNKLVQSMALLQSTAQMDEANKAINRLGNALKASTIQAGGLRNILTRGIGPALKSIGTGIRTFMTTNPLGLIMVAATAILGVVNKIKEKSKEAAEVIKNDAVNSFNQLKATADAVLKGIQTEINRLGTGLVNTIGALKNIDPNKNLKQAKDLIRDITKEMASSVKTFSQYGAAFPYTDAAARDINKVGEEMKRLELELEKLENRDNKTAPVLKRISDVKKELDDLRRESVILGKVYTSSFNLNDFSKQLSNISKNAKAGSEMTEQYTETLENLKKQFPGLWDVIANDKNARKAIENTEDLTTATEALQQQIIKNAKVNPLEFLPESETLALYLENTYMIDNAKAEQRKRRYEVKKQEEIDTKNHYDKMRSTAKDALDKTNGDIQRALESEKRIAEERRTVHKFELDGIQHYSKEVSDAYNTMISNQENADIEIDAQNKRIAALKTYLEELTKIKDPSEEHTKLILETTKVIADEEINLGQLTKAKEADFKVDQDAYIQRVNAYQSRLKEVEAIKAETEQMKELIAVSMKYSGIGPNGNTADKPIINQPGGRYSGGEAASGFWNWWGDAGSSAHQLAEEKDRLLLEMTDLDKQMNTILQGMQDNHTKWMTGQYEADVEYYEKQAELEQRRTEIEREQAEKRREIARNENEQKKLLVEDYLNATMNVLGAVGSVFSSMASISEKDQAKQRKLQIAAAITSTIQGGINAYMAAQSLTPPLNFIVGGANMAAVLATGYANIAKMKNPSESAISGSGVSSAATRTVASPPEIVNLNAMNDNITLPDQRVYVTEHDITAAQRRVRVVESNNTI